MTKYTVIWAPIAHNLLAELWLQADDRSAVTSSADRIDALLAIDPDSNGGDLREGLRTLQIPPLRVIFEIDRPDRRVRVVRVSRIS